MTRRPAEGRALSHVDASGAARMVDVSAKAETARTARAAGAIRMSGDALALVRENRVAKGDVLSVARIAGIMAAKRTSELVPLCHPLPLSSVVVDLQLDEALPGVRVEATVATTARTGVEMEALTAVSVALLTVYDMVKAVDRGMEIGPVMLLEKAGGAGGPWSRA
ncbi:Molybdenum cofactor biosynthesis C, bacterial-type [Gemmatirosa kalamazoonensis]|uniref:Cyclic pyranopterin monophosphate synthase n=1 Tax=Gemmatirosa kalamazoonensis TaxID=861299 RepID=W0RLZ8_9BACT|nr:cyclic pyranopterin monophosphate synthase MoaC [Gemmatirosa kalamazoonensis]AHG91335.1 Molybdenum cofactor biosynthesis C, bacterial-type [Gemmatirosa kalamazoonensis]